MISRLDASLDQLRAKPLAHVKLMIGEPVCAKQREVRRRHRKAGDACLKASIAQSVVGDCSNSPATSNARLWPDDGSQAIAQGLGIMLGG